MIDRSKRDFFKNFLLAGAVVATSGTAVRPRNADACPHKTIKGICLYVPNLGKASEFVELMNRNAPGDWTVHPLTGSLTDCYFKTRSLYEEAKGKANTFVGVVDPGSLALIHAAIVDSGGSFHYITYEERNRVTFSAQI
jgi:hypothetical protein